MDVATVGLMNSQMGVATFIDDDRMNERWPGVRPWLYTAELLGRMLL